MIKGFRDFILRGNVVDLAVGIVVGVAFGALVNSFVANLSPVVRSRSLKCRWSSASGAAQSRSPFGASMEPSSDTDIL